MSDEIVIDQANFSQYFRDCRMHRPERGDIMAKYTAIAEFIDGRMKTDVIDLLMNHEKAYAATQVLRKLGCATEFDSIRICKEIAEDLASGMTPEEIEKKAYEYQMEVFYYTKKEYFPTDNPHWSLISIANLDSFLDKENRKILFQSKIIEPELEGAEREEAKI